MSKVLIKETGYSQLRQAVAQEISVSADRLRQTFQAELVRMYWNVGRVLHEAGFLTDHPSTGNARYIARLAKDFKRPDSFFYDAAKFHRLYPKGAPQNLSWSHYALLIRLDDPQKRRELEKRAMRENISSKDLRVLTRCPDQKSLLPQSKEIISCERGKLYHYRAMSSSLCDLEPGWVLVDIGFSVQRAVRYLGEEGPHSGLIVRCVKDNEEYSARIAPFEIGRLYTYQIKLDRVIDGDTIVARVDMGFRSWSIQRLRLRGIDTPEITSAPGRRAKNEVKARLEGAGCLIARTYKQEKYGRFLADVFYKPGCNDPQEVLEQGIFLNQELLDLGLAVSYDGGAKGV